MTPEKQKIAIAEACGWQPVLSAERDHDKHVWCNLNGGKLWRGARLGTMRRGLPDYLNDLNAMHEAENMLTDEQHKEFRRQLKYVCGTGGSTEEELSIILRARFSATARQRAEAFLKTIGKWEDSQ